mgnify:CR=1 FL=1
MAFDGIVIANLAFELNSSLAGGRISKIYMPDKNEIILHIKNNSKNYKLLISANPSLPLMYLTEESKKNPAAAPAFCMLLRKYLGTAKITAIAQQGLERIICINFEHFDELGDLSKKKLYIELMGKHSNIIFTDSSDKILDSIRRIPVYLSSLREVLPGRQYFLPQELQKSDPLSTDFNEFYSILKQSNQSLIKALYMSFAGISPLCADEVCFRCGINGEQACAWLSEDVSRHVFNIFNILLDEIKNHNFHPAIIYKNQQPFEFASFKLSSFAAPAYEAVYYKSISSLLYNYYSQKNRYESIRQKTADLKKHINSLLEKNNKKYAVQEKQILDSDKKEKFKVYADLINTYSYSLKGGEKTLVCENYYDSGNTISIPLDANLSASENAVKYYEKYSKLKRTKAALTLEIAKTKADIEHLMSILVSLELSEDDEDFMQIRSELAQYGYIKKNSSSKNIKIKSKPIHFISSDGFDIFVGKNNYQNEEVTFKKAAPEDWWFHAKGVPGSHVIVKTEGREMTDRAFEEAAGLAAYYSKSGKNDKVEVDYIQRKNVKKVNGGVPGFVIYHNNWSMSISPSNKLAEVKT